MGADYVVQRGCGLQKKVGPKAFPLLVKQRAQLDSLEDRRAEIEAASSSPLEDLELVMMGTNRRERRVTVQEMRAAVAPLADTAECSGCPIAGGLPLGCYRYVTYPVDAMFEMHFFSYVVSALESGEAHYAIGRRADGGPVTAAQILLQMVRPKLGEEQIAGWEGMRGPAEAGGLAELAAPVERMLRDGTILTSAEVLAMSFAPLIDGLSALRLYAHLFRGFLAYLEREEVDSSSSRTISEIFQLSELLIATTALPKFEVWVDS